MKWKTVEGLGEFCGRTSDLAGTAMAFELMRAPDGKPQVRDWSFFGGLGMAGPCLDVRERWGFVSLLGSAHRLLALELTPG